MWRRFIRRGALVSIGALLALELAVRLAPYPVDRLGAGFRDSVRIRARDGALLREAVNGDGHRAEWRTLSEISPLVAEATVAVEDARFWRHPGVDLIGVARATVGNLIAARVTSGASTLTMQLSRLVRPHPRTLGWKLWEMFDALRIERAVSKEVVLEQYLNRAPYGAGTVGVEAASRRYFGKPSRHLSLGEAALIAGLPKGPSVLSPFHNPDGARRRQVKVLDRMLATGRIDEAMHRRALETEMIYTPRPPSPVALHFTEMVRKRAHRRGDIVSTLDADLQSDLEAMARHHVDAHRDVGLTNAAVVVLENETCAVRGLVGSVDYWDPDHGAVNGALARRQPGSTLKPFTYGLAFERDFTPASVVPDVETRYVNAAGSWFSPRNFSGRFTGPVMLADALGRSLNVPAIRITQALGPDAFAPTASRSKARGGPETEAKQTVPRRASGFCRRGLECIADRGRTGYKRRLVGLYVR